MDPSIISSLKRPGTPSVESELEPTAKKSKADAAPTPTFLQTFFLKQSEEQANLQRQNDSFVANHIPYFNASDADFLKTLRNQTEAVNVAFFSRNPPTRILTRIDHIVSEIATFQNRANWSFLPKDVMSIILSFIEPHELKHTSTVCKTFNKILHDPRILCEVINKSKTKLTKKDFLLLIQKCGPYIHTIDLPKIIKKETISDSFEDEDLIQITKYCPNLKSITFDHRPYPHQREGMALDPGIMAFERLSKLEEIDLVHRSITHESSLINVLISNGHTLKNIKLRMEAFSAWHFVGFISHNLPNFEVLHVEEVGDTVGIDDEVIEKLVKNCKQLKQLYLSNCVVTNEVFNHIARFATNLNSLGLRSCPNVTDNAIQNFASTKVASQLTHIDLSDTAITDSGVRALGDIVDSPLESLVLNDTKVSNYSISYIIHQCKKLNTLHLLGVERDMMFLIPFIRDYEDHRIQTLSLSCKGPIPIWEIDYIKSLQGRIKNVHCGI